MRTMTGPLNGINLITAADHLRTERLRLEKERLKLVSQIKEHQKRIDRIDQRLSEVNDGEKALHEINDR